jgi:hypothetical protein
MSDPRTHFPTTIHQHPPIPWTQPFPAVSSALLPNPPDLSKMAPIHPRIYDPHPPPHYVNRATQPIKRLSFIHGGEIRRNEGLTFDAKNVLNGDSILSKYAYAEGLLVGYAIYGENVRWRFDVFVTFGRVSEVFCSVFCRPVLWIFGPIWDATRDLIRRFYM